MKKLVYIGNKLSDHGFNQTGIERLGPLLENEGFRVVYASSKRHKVLRLLDMFAAIVRHGTSADCVLIDTYSTSNFWYALVISQMCRILGTKYIPILHGGDLPNRLKRTPNLCRLLFAHSYRNVAPSGYLQDAFQKVGFDTILIPNAIATEQYPFRLRNISVPKLLWVRSFSDIYNPKMAVRVLKHLQQNHAGAELCMVGPDKDHTVDSVKALADELGVSVTFTGRLSKAAWIKLSEDYNVFINTTHYDNMPVSVIEAMALGLVVVSTNVGGLPFLLEHGKTALLVNDNDDHDMALCVQKLIFDQDFQQKMVQNAHIITRDFDAQNVASKWVEILRNL